MEKSSLLENIQTWLEQSITCAHLQVAGDGRHFEVLIVSSSFEGLSKVRRHQLVYRALGSRMESEIHALSIRAMTPIEWRG